MIGRELTVLCRKEKPRREVSRKYCLPEHIDPTTVRFRLNERDSTLAISGWKTPEGMKRSMSASNVANTYLALAGAAPKT